MARSDPHTALQNAVIRFLKRSPFKPFVFNVVGHAMQRPGIPDLVVCYRGRFLGLEMKTGKAKPDPRQKVVLREIDRAGGRAVVIHSVEEVALLLQDIDHTFFE